MTDLPNESEKAGPTKVRPANVEKGMRKWKLTRDHAPTGLQQPNQAGPGRKEPYEPPLPGPRQT